MYPGGEKIGVGNGYSNVQAYFEYNEEDGKYYRYQYGDKHIDETTGLNSWQSITLFSSIVTASLDSKGYMVFDVHGGCGLRRSDQLQGSGIYRR